MTNPSKDDEQSTDAPPAIEDNSASQEIRTGDEPAAFLAQVHLDEKAVAETESSGDSTREVPAMIQEALAIQAEAEQLTVQQDKEA
jgi:hypothetical protein